MHSVLYSHSLFVFLYKHKLPALDCEKKNFKHPTAHQKYQSEWKLWESLRQREHF